MMKPENKYFPLVCIPALVVFFDQLTKWIIIRSIDLFEVVPVIHGYLNIVHYRNAGGAFGFFANREADVRGFLFLFISGLAVCLILYLYRKTPAQYKMLLIGLALICGGALGNMIDRLRFGRVVDFIDFHVGHLHWPAFNIADSAISVGMVVFAFYILFRKMPA